MRPVIKVENIGKLYRLGEFGTGTLSHDLNRWWARMRGKEDPFAKIGTENDRTKNDGSKYAWALRDINFEVNEGEVMGIIGRNGAGKSTLLKVLSRVTTPTTGQINVKGRIASLLEVGTGFHPELTGRENIFLNGAILGMTKAEIKSKFDEIVDFAGVTKYVDTPVKRYSSGMYVRLAFAVAAYLDSEILIVDEVLAVGDAEFQKKCLGKMSDISQKDGRTVLFVSHNMPTVQSLCKNTVWLHNGQVKEIGPTIRIVNDYLHEGGVGNDAQVWQLTEPKNGNCYFTKIEVAPLSGSAIIIGEGFAMTCTLNSKINVNLFQLGIKVYDENRMLITQLYNTDFKIDFKLVEGENQFTLRVVNNNLLPGHYTISFIAQYNYGHDIYDTVEEAVKIEVVNADVTGSGVSLLKDRGMVWFKLEK